MKPETRAKIQEALDDYKYVLFDILQYPSMSNRTDSLEEAISALAAEPDEPTVSKSVEELVKQIDFIYHNQSRYPNHRAAITPLIQQFLDSQIAGKDSCDGCFHFLDNPKLRCFECARQATDFYETKSEAPHEL